MDEVAPVLLVALSATGDVIETNAADLPSRSFGADAGGLERALVQRFAELLDLTAEHGEGVCVWLAGGRSLVTAAGASAGGGISTATIDATDLAGGVGEIERLDHLDRLTGLVTRAAVIERLNTMLRRAGRDQTVVGVMVVQLDDAGPDARIVEAAEALFEETRSGDVVGRLGTGEFAVVFGSSIGEVEARVVADRVLDTLGDVHVGLAFATTPQTAASLVDEARAAAELARSTGVTRVFALEDSERDSLDWSGRRVAELRLAIDVGQLIVEYQPIVDLNNGVPRSLEALVRWDHPAEGRLLPSAFVPLAERTGLVSMMTDWVFDEALARLAAEPTLVPIAVNVTASDLLHGGFAEGLTARLGSHGVEPHRLRLELTETAVLADPARASVVLGRLRDAGMGVSLDDFGTGESSLAMLTRLPVDCLKIDLAFVAGLPDSPADLAVVRLVVGLGRELGLDVVAEGVETEAQRDALVALGCRYGQGFLFARPTPG